MKYGGLKFHDIADGLGLRTSLFVSGCTHHCRNCFQPETWNFDYGLDYTEEVEDRILASLDSPFVKGLTILGGEPFEPSNQAGLISLYRRFHNDHPDKDLWCYSGYTWEELTGDSRARCEYTDEILSYVDVLVDGEYIDELHDISLLFRGSSNQRLIDVKKTLSGDGTVVLYNL